MGPSPPAARDGGVARPPGRRVQGVRAQRSPPGRTADAPGADARDGDPATTAAEAGPALRREVLNAPSSRTNIALPFSQIKLQEPSAELAEMAGVLCELIEALDQPLPKAERAQLNDVYTRAQALRARVR